MNLRRRCAALEREQARRLSHLEALQLRKGSLGVVAPVVITSIVVVITSIVVVAPVVIANIVVVGGGSTDRDYEYRGRDYEYRSRWGW